MLRSHLLRLVPGNKSDLGGARAVIELGFPAVEPILPELVEWMQDMNWPVAQELQPFLASIGMPLLPHIRRVLGTDDADWKLWILDYLVHPSLELREALRPELERLAANPTADERELEIDALARDLLTTS